jgi:hypothetical protein
MQELLVIILFLGALVFLGRHLYRQYSGSDDSCGPQCGCETKSVIKKAVEQSATPK